MERWLHLLKVLHLKKPRAILVVAFSLLYENFFLHLYCTFEEDRDSDKVNVELKKRTMRKILASLLLVFVAFTSAKAQFEQGTKYIGASVSGLNLSYSANEHFRLGLNASAGMFVADGLLVYANVGYDHQKHLDNVNVGLNGRYYFSQNGIFIGAGAEYDHFTKSNNDLMIPVEIGYCFYLNHYLSIEPSVYYKMSTTAFSDNSTVGLRIGLGYFF